MYIFELYPRETLVMQYPDDNLKVGPSHAHTSAEIEFLSRAPMQALEQQI